MTQIKIDALIAAEEKAWEAARTARKAAKRERREGDIASPGVLTWNPKIRLRIALADERAHVLESEADTATLAREEAEIMLSRSNSQDGVHTHERPCS